MRLMLLGLGIALLVVAASLLVLGLGGVLSLQVTSRRPRQQDRSPSEYNLAYEEVSFPASDGLTLRGWWIPAQGSARAVILLHGKSGSMDPDVKYAPALHAAGLNLLMFDFRAHGRSDGTVSSLGYLERRDVLGAVRWVIQKGMRQIGLLGFSMGGVVAMLVTPLCPEVGAVISDGGFARLTTALREGMHERGIPPGLCSPLAWLAVTITSLRVGANLFRFQPVDWVGKISPRPIFFIHGEHDPYLPMSEFRELTGAAGEPKEVWSVSQASHRNVDEGFPEQYLARVVRFLDQHLRP